METVLFCELAKKAYLPTYLSIGCEEDDRRFDSDKSCLYRVCLIRKILSILFFVRKNWNSVNEDTS